MREKINTFNVDVHFQGAIYKAGSPLFAIAEGLGLRRQTPDLRRFLGFAGMIVEPADPIVFAPHYHLRPISYHYETRIAHGANVLVVPTIGDTNVPIDTGIAIARAAGIIPLFEPDPRYPDPSDPSRSLSANQVLIRNYVVEGIDKLNRFTHPKTGKGILFDPDNLSEGRDGYGAPRLNPPLRLTVSTDTGVAGMRIPYVKPTGDHGFETPNPSLQFDIHTYMVNLIGLYFRSQGKEIRDNVCLEDNSCKDIPPAD